MRLGNGKHDDNEYDREERDNRDAGTRRGERVRRSDRRYREGYGEDGERDHSLEDGYRSSRRSRHAAEDEDMNSARDRRDRRRHRREYGDADDWEDIEHGHHQRRTDSPSDTGTEAHRRVPGKNINSKYRRSNLLDYPDYAMEEPLRGRHHGEAASRHSRRNHDDAVRARRRRGRREAFNAPDYGNDFDDGAHDAGVDAGFDAGIAD